MATAISQRVLHPSEPSDAPDAVGETLGRLLPFAAPEAPEDDAALLDRYLFDREWRWEVTAAAAPAQLARKR